MRNAPAFDKEKLDDLQPLVDELEDLKERDAKEQLIKEQNWRKFADSFITREEFDFLWRHGGFREEALKDSANKDAVVEEAGEHSLYQTF